MSIIHILYTKWSVTVVYITKLIQKEKNKEFSHGPQTTEAEALTCYYYCLQINEKCRTTKNYKLFSAISIKRKATTKMKKP